MAFSFSLVALDLSADIGEHMVKDGVCRQPVADGINAVQDRAVVTVAEQVRDALRAEGIVPLRHRPAEVGPHQIHAELTRLIDRTRPVAGAELSDAHVVFAGDHAPDAARFGHLAPSQTLQRLLLIGSQWAHGGCSPL